MDPNIDLEEILADQQRWVDSNGRAGRLAGFAGLDLYQADLSNRCLVSVNFRGTNLGGARLCGSDLTNADMSGANLNGANLIGTRLEGVDFTGAVLIKANLPYRIVQIGPIGSECGELIYKVGINEVRRGCFKNQTLQDFANKVESAHGSDKFGVEYRLVIEYLKLLRREYAAEKVSE